MSSTTQVPGKYPNGYPGPVGFWVVIAVWAMIFVVGGVYAFELLGELRQKEHVRDAQRWTVVQYTGDGREIGRWRHGFDLRREDHWVRFRNENGNWVNASGQFKIESEDE